MGLGDRPFRCNVLAVGTELLLGYIVDTNSTWIGEQLALVGIDTHAHVKIGDNQARIVEALRELLAKSEAVIVCGGIGPTSDDITRYAIAEVMNVELERRDEVLDFIAAMFSARGSDMPESNKRQADFPVGATVLDNPNGTAPGFRCAVGRKVVYVVPGVPHEMKEMVTNYVLPDLSAMKGDHLGIDQQATIVSRVVKTWGMSEARLGEMLTPRVEALEGRGNPTIAFLARGIEGIVVRITTKASTEAEARACIEPEEQAVRELLGDLVFGVDDETMESALVETFAARGLTLAIAESLTGGLVSARMAAVPGASAVFRGSVVAYASDLKHALLGVRAEKVVSEECAQEMAEGVRKALSADVGLALTGVAGPDELEGEPVGTVILGFALGDTPAESVRLRMPGGRDQVRQFATITALNMLRLRVMAATQDSRQTVFSSARAVGGYDEREPVD